LHLIERARAGCGADGGRLDGLRGRLALGRLRWGVAILAVGNVALFASFQAALPVGVWGHLG